MACVDLNSSQRFLNKQQYDVPLEIVLEDNNEDELLPKPDAASSYLSNNVTVPNPPPPPNVNCRTTNIPKRLTGCYCVPYEAREAWDRLFDEGYKADVHVFTDDGGRIQAHTNILGITSHVLRGMLEGAKFKEGFRCIKIKGVPSEAVRVLIRFLYSSCYDPEDMRRFVLHLLVMSHSFAVPSLKRACVQQLEQALLTADNVVDVLQLARECDAPRLSLVCIHLIIKDFKTISLSEGWKVMKRANPSLEQELLESLVEADSRRQEKVKRVEERKTYTQLHEGMEALLHIYRDGCRTIGPRDKMLDESLGSCSYPACETLESLLRHFSGCKTRVTGACQQCNHLGKLFALHSRMCAEPDLCRVPLCRQFKDKVKLQNKKDDIRWKLLVRKVMMTKGTISSISAWRSVIAQPCVSVHTK